jgi:Ca2+-binding RTX toxin-like protein
VTRFRGEDGNDVLDGGDGDDWLYSGNDNGARDDVIGGSGADRAEVNRRDARSSIEELLN